AGAAAPAPRDTVTIVRESWARVSGDLQAVGDLFYSKLFETAPGLKTTVFAGTDLRAQSLRLMEMVDGAVKLLDAPDKLIPALKELGERHTGYGTQPEHYPVVGEVLMATLKLGLGSAMTAEVEAAWSEVYGTIQQTMVAGSLSPRGVEMARRYAEKHAAGAAAPAPARTPAAAELKIPSPVSPVPSAPSSDAALSQRFARGARRQSLNVVEVPPTLEEAMAVVQEEGVALCEAANGRVFNAFPSLHDEMVSSKAMERIFLVWLSVAKAGNSAAKDRSLQQALSKLGVELAGVGCAMTTVPVIGIAVNSAIAFLLDFRDYDRGPWATVTAQVIKGVSEGMHSDVGRRALQAFFQNHGYSKVCSASADDIALVASVWVFVKPNLEEVGNEFYDQFFAKHQDLKATIFLGTNFLTQAIRVMEMFDAAIEAMCDPVALMELLVPLGERHALYGIRKEHYDIFWPALCIALKEQLGDKLTDDVVQSLHRVYYKVIQVMLESGKTERGRAYGRQYLVRHWSQYKPHCDVVAESWARISSDLPLLGARFYNHLFDLEPSLKDTVFAEVDMKSQSRRLMVLIDRLVESFIDPVMMLDSLRSAGEIHAGYGVEEEHYGTFAKALVTTLRFSLHQEFTTSIEESWKTVYGVWQDAMIDGSNGTRGRMLYEQWKERTGNAAPSDAEVIQRTWNLVLRLGDTPYAFGEAFYNQLFVSDPHLQETLFEHSDMKEVPRKFVMMLDTVVRLAGSPSQTQHEVLLTLGARHCSYGVSSDHYNAVVKAFIEVLRMQLGPQHFNKEIDATWRKFLNQVSDLMREGADTKAGRTRLRAFKEAQWRMHSDTFDRVKASWAAMDNAIFCGAVLHELSTIEHHVMEGPMKNINQHDLSVKIADFFKDLLDLIDDPDTVANLCTLLGQRHAGYGLGKTHLASFHKAFLATLEAAATQGPKDKQTMAAWKKFLDIVTTHMADGMQSERGREMTKKFANKNTQAKRTDAELVRDSWAMVSDDLAAVGDLFYSKLFEYDITLRQTVFRGTNFGAQARIVMEFIDAGISLLDKPEELHRALYELGERHGLYGIVEEHYAPLGEALLSALRQAVGSDFTPEVEGAWARVFTFMKNTILEGTLSQRGRALLVKYYTRRWKEMEPEIEMVITSWRHCSGTASRRAFEDAMLKQMRKQDDMMEETIFKIVPEAADHGGHPGQRLVVMIDSAMEMLRDREAFVVRLRELGVRHACFGLTKEHVLAISLVLPRALYDIHKATWSDELEAGWIRVFAAMQTHLLEGLHSDKGKELTRQFAQRHGLFTPTIVRTIRTTWAAATKDMDAFGDRLYTAVFALDRTLKETIFKGTNMSAQAHHIIETLDSCVRIMDQPNHLMSMLRQLGVRHGAYGVGRHHYPTIGKALISALEGSLEDKFTLEVNKSWTKFFNVIERSMLEGTESEKGKNLAASYAARNASASPKDTLAEAVDTSGRRLKVALAEESHYSEGALAEFFETYHRLIQDPRVVLTDSLEFVSRLQLSALKSLVFKLLTLLERADRVPELTAIQDIKLTRCYGLPPDALSTMLVPKLRKAIASAQLMNGLEAVVRVMETLCNKAIPADILKRDAAAFSAFVEFAVASADLEGRFAAAFLATAVSSDSIGFDLQSARNIIRRIELIGLLREVGSGFESHQRTLMTCATMALRLGTIGIAKPSQFLHDTLLSSAKENLVRAKIPQVNLTRAVTVISAVAEILCVVEPISFTDHDRTLAHQWLKHTEETTFMRLYPDMADTLPALRTTVYQRASMTSVHLAFYRSLVRVCDVNMNVDDTRYILKSVGTRHAVSGIYAEHYHVLAACFSSIIHHAEITAPEPSLMLAIRWVMRQMQTAANSMQQRALTQYNDADIKSIIRVQAQSRMKSARRVMFKLRLLGAGTLKEILNLKDDDEHDEDDDDWDKEVALSKKDVASVRLIWTSILDRQLNCFFEAFSSLPTTGAPKLSLR
ncbi:globin domain-containing protein, putative, partial [Bodo saltans]